MVDHSVRHTLRAEGSRPVHLCPHRGTQGRERRIAGADLDVVAVSGGFPQRLVPREGRARGTSVSHLERRVQDLAPRSGHGCAYGSPDLLGGTGIGDCRPISCGGFPSLSFSAVLLFLRVSYT